MNANLAPFRSAEADESAEAPSPSEGFRWRMTSMAIRIVFSLTSLTLLMLAAEAGRRWS
jgi:hypothetical protein